MKPAEVKSLQGMFQNISGEKQEFTKITDLLRVTANVQKMAGRIDITQSIDKDIAIYIALVT